MWRFEETHKQFAKEPYQLTPKRTDTLNADLFKAFEYTEKPLFICREASRLLFCKA